MTFSKTLISKIVEICTNFAFELLLYCHPRWNLVSFTHTVILYCCRVQRQVDEVIDVMKDNVDKVLDRGEKLEDLQEKSGEANRGGWRV